MGVASRAQDWNAAGSTGRRSPGGTAATPLSAQLSKPSPSGVALGLESRATVGAAL